MKYIITFFLLFLSLLRADTITITADEWCPYNCEENAKDRGFFVDIFTHVFKEAGYKVKYTVSRSYEQAIKDVRENRYDALIATTKKETPDFIFTKKAMSYSYDVFMIPEDSSWKYTGTDSLNEVVLGAVKGYDYGDDINTYINKHKDNNQKIQLISGNHSFRYSLKKLRYKKITALIDDQLLIRHYQLKNKNNFPFKRVNKLWVYPLYIAFSPKNYKSKRYAKILNRGLKKLEGTPELKKILNRYGISENDIKDPQ